MERLCFISFYSCYAWRPTRTAEVSTHVERGGVSSLWRPKSQSHHPGHSPLPRARGVCYKRWGRCGGVRWYAAHPRDWSGTHETVSSLVDVSAFVLPVPRTSGCKVTGWRRWPRPYVISPSWKFCTSDKTPCRTCPTSQGRGSAARFIVRVRTHTEYS